MGKHKTALSLIRNVPETAMDWQLLEQLGDIHFYLKDMNSARECYLQALRSNNSKNVVLKLGKLYLKEGESEKTQQLFTSYAEK